MQTKSEFLAAETLDDLPFLISRYEIDPTHASALFKVRHMTVALVRGELGEVNGVVMLDRDDITQSSVNATIDVTAITTRDPDRDARLRNAGSLDVEKFPTITFQSTRIEKASPASVRVIGNLTIRGTTYEIGLVVEISDELRDPWGNVRRRATATTRIDSQNFGDTWNAVMDADGLVVADMVDITIELQLVRKPI